MVKADSVNIYGYNYDVRDCGAGLWNGKMWYIYEG